jgi:peptidoglycan/LPS O-acetylase OafA/YrhL
MNITKAAAAYWALIFALGFVLGTVRTLWGAQALGEANFILIEIPVMLSASWLAARWLVARYEVPPGGPALAMGGIAFALLMLAEAALTAMLGGNPAHWLASLAAPPVLYGFLGQIAFGLMPWIVARSGGRA